MAQKTDISALRKEWKTLFTHWHLSGCKEGGWYCTKEGGGYCAVYYEMRSTKDSLDDYLKCINGGLSPSGFTGVRLYYFNGMVSLVACCENEIHYTFLRDYYTRNYSAKDFTTAFSIRGISPSVQQNKHCDYLLLQGTLSAFENSYFYSDCERIYANRLAAKQEKERLLQTTIADVLNRKEQIAAILQSPLFGLILGFHEINCASFWNCNAFEVRKDCVYARKMKDVFSNYVDDNYYAFRFLFEEHGYQRLDYLNCSLLAVALILERYGFINALNDEVVLRELLIKANFDCDKEKISFIYNKPEEKTVPKNLKSLLE